MSPCGTSESIAVVCVIMKGIHKINFCEIIWHLSFENVCSASLCCLLRFQSSYIFFSLLHPPLSKETDGVDRTQVVSYILQHFI